MAEQETAQRRHVHHREHIAAPGDAKSNLILCAQMSSSSSSCALKVSQTAQAVRSTLIDYLCSAHAFHAACPWSQRVRLALLECGLKHDLCEIDLENKPIWFSKVNAAGEAPVLAFGGVEQDTHVFRLPESTLIVEAIADLCQIEHPLLPKTALERARARHCVSMFDRAVWIPYKAILYHDQTDQLDALYRGMDDFELLLQNGVRDSGGPFLFGARPGFQDVCIAPFLARLMLLSSSSHEIGAVARLGVADRLRSDERYASCRAYWEAWKQNENFSKTFSLSKVVRRIVHKRAALAQEGEPQQRAMHRQETSDSSSGVAAGFPGSRRFHDVQQA